MKKKYHVPEFEVVEFEERDVVCSSGCDPFEDIPCGEAGCDMEGIACTPGVG